MPVNNYPERWIVYTALDTKEYVLEWLEPGESLSQFVRVAIERELTRRERSAA